jgi:AcrR family transcriptional regulator
MSFRDRQTRLDSERQLIREAAQRLLAGTPARSDAKLTVATLAIEAGLSRQRLYEHHPDLIAEFKTATGRGPVPPNVEALQRQLADADSRIQQLEACNNQLRAQITTLCAVITELTHEAAADNVVTLPRRRGR